MSVGVVIVLSVFLMLTGILLGFWLWLLHHTWPVIFDRRFRTINQSPLIQDRQMRLVIWQNLSAIGWVLSSYCSLPIYWLVLDSTPVFRSSLRSRTAFSAISDSLQWLSLCTLNSCLVLRMFLLLYYSKNRAIHQDRQWMQMIDEHWALITQYIAAKAGGENGLTIEQQRSELDPYGASPSGFPDITEVIRSSGVSGAGKSATSSRESSTAAGRSTPVPLPPLSLTAQFSQNSLRNNKSNKQGGSVNNSGDRSNNSTPHVRSQNNNNNKSDRPRIKDDASESALKFQRQTSHPTEATQRIDERTQQLEMDLQSMSEKPRFFYIHTLGTFGSLRWLIMRYVIPVLIITFLLTSVLYSVWSSRLLFEWLLMMIQCLTLFMLYQVWSQVSRLRAILDIWREMRFTFYSHFAFLICDLIVVLCKLTVFIPGSLLYRRDFGPTLPADSSSIGIGIPVMYFILALMATLSICIQSIVNLAWPLYLVYVQTKLKFGFKFSTFAWPESRNKHRRQLTSSRVSSPQISNPHHHPIHSSVTPKAPSNERVVSGPLPIVTADCDIRLTPEPLASPELSSADPSPGIGSSIVPNLSNDPSPNDLNVSDETNNPKRSSLSSVRLSGLLSLPKLIVQTSDHRHQRPALRSNDSNGLSSADDIFSGGRAASGSGSASLAPGDEGSDESGTRVNSRVRKNSRRKSSGNEPKFEDIGLSLALAFDEGLMDTGRAFSARHHASFTLGESELTGLPTSFYHSLFQLFELGLNHFRAHCIDRSRMCFYLATGGFGKSSKSGSSSSSSSSSAKKKRPNKKKSMSLLMKMKLTRREGLRKVLSTPDGVTCFVEYLNTEYCAENLLALIEFTQFEIHFTAMRKELEDYDQVSDSEDGNGDDSDSSESTRSNGINMNTLTHTVSDGMETSTSYNLSRHGSVLSMSGLLSQSQVGHGRRRDMKKPIQLPKEKLGAFPYSSIVHLGVNDGNNQDSTTPMNNQGLIFDSSSQQNSKKKNAMMPSDRPVIRAAASGSSSSSRSSMRSGSLTGSGMRNGRVVGVSAHDAMVAALAMDSSAPTPGLSLAASNEAGKDKNNNSNLASFVGGNSFMDYCDNSYETSITEAFLALINKYVIPGAKYEINIAYETRKNLLFFHNTVQNYRTNPAMVVDPAVFSTVCRELTSTLSKNYDRWTKTLNFIHYAKCQEFG